VALWRRASGGRAARREREERFEAVVASVADTLAGEGWVPSEGGAPNERRLARPLAGPLRVVLSLIVVGPEDGGGRALVLADLEVEHSAAARLLERALVVAQASVECDLGSDGPVEIPVDGAELGVAGATTAIVALARRVAEAEATRFSSPATWEDELARAESPYDVAMVGAAIRAASGDLGGARDRLVALADRDDAGARRAEPERLLEVLDLRR
jgi:hypothetical protein